MSRRTRIFVVILILLASAAIAAFFRWHAREHQIAMRYVVGIGAIVLGIGFLIVHSCASDASLARHFGGEGNVAKFRKMFRGGWVGVLLGAAMVALEYFGGLRY